MKIFYKISKFCSSWSNIGQFGPKKGQNWAKIAKTMPYWLEAIIGHFFNLVKGAEQKYFLKFPNFDLEGSQRVKLDPKKSQNWTKRAKTVFMGLYAKTRPLFNLSRALNTLFPSNFQILLLEGQNSPLRPKQVQISIPTKWQNPCPVG